MSARFVADVGGTNIRLARTVDGQLVGIKKYLCNDYATISDVIKEYIADFPDLEFDAGCIGIACPVNSDLIIMTNHTWRFSVQELKEELGLAWLHVINDYTSVSMCLPVLTDEQKVQIGHGEVKDRQNIAVFGPGTGLGVGHLVPVDNGWQCLDGEGGHVDLPIYNKDDFIVWEFLRDKYGYASAEEALSGRGLVQIYEAIALHKKLAVKYTEPAQITTNALNGHCNVCVAALNRFCELMGTFAGNLALNVGAHGGVYIAGGIAQRFVDFLKASDFRARFEAKGRFQQYVADIPTFVITEPDHGLIGTAAYLEQNYKG